jgi:hypothetical protein
VRCLSAIEIGMLNICSGCACCNVTSGAGAWAEWRSRPERLRIALNTDNLATWWAAAVGNFYGSVCGWIWWWKIRTLASNACVPAVAACVPANDHQ